MMTSGYSRHAATWRGREIGEVKRSVTVSIDGKQVPLRSDAEPAYLEELASYVERQLREIQVGKPVNPYRTAVLVALNIADELFKERRDHAELKTMVRERCRRILEYVTAIEAVGSSRKRESPPREEEVR
jgi:cell division protein ZapA (FtsZ GTPase activity inhibitor)